MKKVLLIVSILVLLSSGIFIISNNKKTNYITISTNSEVIMEEVN